MQQKIWVQFFILQISRFHISCWCNPYTNSQHLLSQGNKEEREYFVLANINMPSRHLYMSRGLWRRLGIFIANFDHISQLALVLLLLTLNM